MLKVVAIIFAIILLFPVIDNINAEKIPNWIRTLFGWYEQGQISEDELTNATQYLLQNRIIKFLECKGTGLCLIEQVTKVVDGDTIYTTSHKIRLSLTNTPERGQAGYLEATEFTKNLCPLYSVIMVDQDDKQPYDTYGRLVGKVFCDNKILNSELLTNGYANILEQYCSKSEFLGEAWAQKYGCATNTQELKQQIPKESQTPTASGECDPSYPDVCISPYPPDLDCGEIPYKNFRVLPPDPHGFDRDNDGIGCES